MPRRGSCSDSDLVLAQKPGKRHVTITDGPTCITRQSEATLDMSHDLCRVRFELNLIDSTNRVQQWREEHTVRYYFLQELEHMFRRSQLDLFHFLSFPDDESPADARAWNAVGVARTQ